MRCISYLKRHGWRCLLFGAVMTATAAPASCLLLSHLYRFLTFDPQFHAIFAQIADAPMVPPVLLLLLLSCLYCLPAAHLAAKGTGGRVAAILVGVPVWLLLLAVSLLLTEVNRVLFADVLFSLLDLLKSGVL